MMKMKKELLYLRSKHMKHNIPNRLSFSISTIILLAAFLYSLYFQDNLHVVVSFLLLIVTFVLYVKNLLPLIFTLLFPLTTLTYMLGSQHTFDLYRHISWYDNVVHFVTAFVITLLIGSILYQQKKLLSGKNKKILHVIILTSLGLAVGVGWEVVEWLFESVIIPLQPMTVYDLMTDLIIDSIGAFIAATAIVSNES